ncbi:sugar acetyltransferase [Lysinibacillus sp. B2A1]|nr:sugar acetyltransferase [Lysinibacillus sp. B2A1]
MNKPIIIIGNGGHASVLVETLLMLNYEILGFTSPEKQQNVFGLTYLGNDEAILSFSPSEIELVLGIGTVNFSKIRQKIYLRFRQQGFKFADVIHPTAIIAPSVHLGEGVQIMAGTVLQTHVHIADNTIVNTGAIIDHNSKIGAHTHIAPGTKISGGVDIGDLTHIGTGATIIQSINIGNQCVVGAGAVVIKNILHAQKVHGVPAREVK